MSLPSATTKVFFKGIVLTTVLPVKPIVIVIKLHSLVSKVI